MDTHASWALAGIEPGSKSADAVREAAKRYRVPKKVCFRIAKMIQVFLDAWEGRMRSLRAEMMSEELQTRCRGPFAWSQQALPQLGGFTAAAVQSSNLEDVWLPMVHHALWGRFGTKLGVISLSPDAEKRGKAALDEVLKASARARKNHLLEPVKVDENELAANMAVLVAMEYASSTPVCAVAVAGEIDKGNAVATPWEKLQVIEHHAAVESTRAAFTECHAAAFDQEPAYYSGEEEAACVSVDADHFCSMPFQGGGGSTADKWPLPIPLHRVAPQEHAAPTEQIGGAESEWSMQDIFAGAVPLWSTDEPMQPSVAVPVSDGIRCLSAVTFMRLWTAVYEGIQPVRAEESDRWEPRSAEDLEASLSTICQGAIGTEKVSAMEQQDFIHIIAQAVSHSNAPNDFDLFPDLSAPAKLKTV